MKELKEITKMFVNADETYKIQGQLAYREWITYVISPPHTINKHGITKNFWVFATTLY